jgi:hypothetical protein
MSGSTTLSLAQADIILSAVPMNQTWRFQAKWIYKAETVEVQGKKERRIRR